MLFPARDTIHRFRLDGKVSIITGASRGLGRAMAEALAGAGSDLVLVGRQQDTLDEVARAITESTGRRTLALQLDVAEVAAIVPAVERMLSEFGRLDVLINNAGINFRNPATEYTTDEWDQVLDVNLKGTFFLTQAVGKQMIEQSNTNGRSGFQPDRSNFQPDRSNGKIINILSLTTAWGLPTVIAYTATKAGLLGLTRTLAVEWAEHNIQVNGIAPGFFRTEMTAPVQKDQRSNWILNRTPARRWAEPEELCGAALFLASPASDYVTGITLWVDGGMTAGSDWRRGE